MANQTNIEWPGLAAKVSQVCTLQGDKLILFGKTSHLINVLMLGSKTGKLLDQFYTYNLSMSPNQRWLVYGKWFPRSTDDPPSAEFLLYDLTKDAAANRPARIPVDNPTDVGRAIYLSGFKNENGDNLALPIEQVHDWRGSGFTWSADSKFVAAADYFRDRLRVVLVDVTQPEEPRPFISVIPKDQTCQVDGDGKVMT